MSISIFVNKTLILTIQENEIRKIDQFEKQAQSIIQDVSAVLKTVITETKNNNKRSSNKMQ